jgi:hypothetical protein
METRHSTQDADLCRLNFKAFLEMAHLIPRRNGQLNPLYINGRYIRGIDFKFETYPDKDLKRNLLSIDASFYAPLEDNHYLVFDGNELDVKQFFPKSAFQLPPYWYDKALIEFLDGKIKQPKN